MGAAIRLCGLAALSFAIGLLVSSRLSTAVVDVCLLIALGVLVGCLNVLWFAYLYQQLLAGALFCAGVVIGSGKFVELSPSIMNGRYKAVLVELVCPGADFSGVHARYARRAVGLFTCSGTGGLSAG